MVSASITSAILSDIWLLICYLTPCVNDIFTSPPLLSFAPPHHSPGFFLPARPALAVPAVLAKNGPSDSPQVYYSTSGALFLLIFLGFVLLGFLNVFSAFAAH